MTTETATRPKINEAAADKAVGFIEALTHVQGVWAGKPFVLMPWQREIIRTIFGTLNDDGSRQYRTVYIEIPRKNGKTELAAAIALYLLFADGELGAEIYGAASDRDQASLVFQRAAQMVRQSQVLMAASKIIDSTKRIVFPKHGSFLRAIPADVPGSHGYNAHGIIFDELHVQPNRDLWDALKKSTGTRRQPLIVAITTAGYDRESICWELHEYARKIIEGVIEDPTFFAYIAAAPEDADWKDEAVWYACNPALVHDGGKLVVGGPFRSIGEMRAEARQAEHMPTAQNDFLRYYLNRWTQQATRWIDMALWDENGGVIDEEALAGQICYGGLDLSSVRDMTAWVMLFPDDDGGVQIVARFWCPEARLYADDNRYRDQYQVWTREGWLETTPGNSIDYNYVTAKVLEDAEKFRVKELNIDRLFQGYQVGTALADEDMEVFGFGMGFISMAGPMREFERLLLAHKLNHGNNPILRFNADNIMVKVDAADNKKPDKATSQGKIDGIVGILMGLDRSTRQHEEEEAGVLFV